jgi:hypothetical protein
MAPLTLRTTSRTIEVTIMAVSESQTMPFSINRDSDSYGGYQWFAGCSEARNRLTVLVDEQCVWLTYSTGERFAGCASRSGWRRRVLSACLRNSMPCHAMPCHAIYRAIPIAHQLRVHRLGDHDSACAISFLRDQGVSDSSIIQS